MIALIQVVSNSTQRNFEAPFASYERKFPKPGSYSITVKYMSDKPITVQIGGIKAETLAPKMELSREYAISDNMSVLVKVLGESLNWQGIVQPSGNNSLSINDTYVY